MFRPSEEIFTELLKAVKDYDGAVVWVIDDDCIGAWKAKPNLTGTVRLTTPVSDEEIRKHNEALRQPPDPEFIEKAVADIPVFCTYLEMRLGLKDREPQQFDPRWLTAEGLAQSKGEFEDFLEAECLENGNLILPVGSPNVNVWQFTAVQCCFPQLMKIEQ